MTVTVDFPDGVLTASTDAARQVFEAVVLRAYQDARISQGKVAELLNLSFWETEALLARKGIWLAYSEVDLDADRQAVSPQGK